MPDGRLCKVQVLVVSCGAAVTVTVGLVVLCTLDSLLWIFATLAAGAGHDPGDEIAALLKATVVQGNLFALWGAAMPLIWLAWRSVGRVKRTGATLIGRIASLVPAAGVVGMALIVNIVWITVTIKTLRFASDFLGIMSNIWYVLLFFIPPILVSALVGGLAIVASILAGVTVSIILGEIVNLANRRRARSAEKGSN